MNLDLQKTGLVLEGGGMRGGVYLWSLGFHDGSPHAVPLCDRCVSRSL
mgnify:CR=1 FL=1